MSLQIVDWDYRVLQAYLRNLTEPFRLALDFFFNLLSSMAWFDPERFFPMGHGFEQYRIYG